MNDDFNIYDNYNINYTYISKFHNNAEFAESLIFDDNDISHYDIVFPILNK